MKLNKSDQDEFIQSFFLLMKQESLTKDNSKLPKFFYNNMTAKKGECSKKRLRKNSIDLL